MIGNNNKNNNSLNTLQVAERRNFELPVNRRGCHYVYLRTIYNSINILRVHLGSSFQSDGIIVLYFVGEILRVHILLLKSIIII